MTLGEKLKNARLEAGLSQRGLCGDAITRNMLSQIEHGTARPSMDTLRYLARRLGKPISYFLEEQTACSPNQAAVEAARSCWQTGDWEGTLAALEDFREPDPLLEGEYSTLLALALVTGAEQAVQTGRRLYALELLGRLEGRKIPYFEEALERRRLLVLAQAGGLEGLDGLLPSLDEELLLRAKSALARGNGLRAGKLLDALENPRGGLWNCLRGQSWLLLEEYAKAVPHLQLAEEDYPEKAVPALEQCFRELGDYRQAYYYACKQKG